LFKIYDAFPDGIGRTCALAGEKSPRSVVRLADGAADAPGEVVNTIAGRLRASLEIGGINVPLK